MLLFTRCLERRPLRRVMRPIYIYIYIALQTYIFGSAPAYAPSQLEPKLHHDLVILSFCLCLSVRQYAPEERKADGNDSQTNFA